MTPNAAFVTDTSGSDSMQPVLAPLPDMSIARVVDIARTEFAGLPCDNARRPAVLRRGSIYIPNTTPKVHAQQRLRQYYQRWHLRAFTMYDSYPLTNSLYMTLASMFQRRIRIESGSVVIFAIARVPTSPVPLLTQEPFEGIPSILTKSRVWPGKNRLAYREREDGLSDVDSNQAIALDGVRVLEVCVKLTHVRLFGGPATKNKDNSSVLTCVASYA